VNIVDVNGGEMPAGELGEVVVRGPTVMAGYFEQDDARTLRDGALYTGDMGYVDADGDLWIVQRRKDLIVSGGENIYPAEIETVISQHPAVAEVYVVGIPDDEWGQVVAAAVKLHAGQTLTVEEIDALCQQRLAGYKRPRITALVNEFPQTSNGKIHRQRLAEELAALRLSTGR
jgi:acyl-CoA synthetase (AMP-forming)/AMP-acid ligase II